MIKLVFILLYNILRWGWIKMLHGNKFQGHPIQRISTGCALKIFNHATMVIGKNCELADGCCIEAHGQGVLQIGGHVYMNRYCMISCQNAISIGSGCIFGPGVKVFDNNHQFSAKEGVSQMLNTAPIHIGKNCWIASDVVILKGVTIGDNCLIGAGCIISEDVPSGMMVKQDNHLIMTPIRK